MKKLNNIHPGEVLKEEFLIPMNVTAYRLAKETHISQTAISEIIRGRRSITPSIALRFAAFFSTTPQFWLGLQTDYDLEEEMTSLAKELKSIKPFELTGI